MTGSIAIRSGKGRLRCACRSAYPEPTDLVIANYVYEKAHTTMRYRNVFPTGKAIRVGVTKGFRQSHLPGRSVSHRAQLLR